MQLGPGFHKPPLRSRQLASDHVDRRNTQDGSVVLVVRVEMRRMVNGAGLDEHADHNSEEPTDLRQRDYPRICESRQQVPALLLGEPASRPKPAAAEPGETP